VQRKTETGFQAAYRTPPDFSSILAKENDEQSHSAPKAGNQAEEKKVKDPIF
jgi:hypothetical protein